MLQPIQHALHRLRIRRRVRVAVEVRARPQRDRAAGPHERRRPRPEARHVEPVRCRRCGEEVDAAVAAVRRSTLPGGRAEASSAPGRSSAVEMAKWIGVAGTTSSAVPVPVVECLARAASIIAMDGSTPKARVKCGANERVAVPGPQPTSSRVVSWPPVERWWVRIVSIRASG
jgi:hypothetical protein